MLDALRRTWRHQGDWSVTFVRESQTAWDTLQQSTYDAVVLDIRMPGMGGLELLERMQQSEKTRDIPVVMLTAMSDRDLKEKSAPARRGRPVEQAGGRRAVDGSTPQRARSQEISG